MKINGRSWSIEGFPSMDKVLSWIEKSCVIAKKDHKNNKNDRQKGQAHGSSF